MASVMVGHGAWFHYHNPGLKLGQMNLTWVYQVCWTLAMADESREPTVSFARLIFMSSWC